MCIRDRARVDGAGHVRVFFQVLMPLLVPAIASFGIFQFLCCLLYTSDAADERSSVDLGGRRIIKKKTLVNV